jgi:hypothetical protein
LRISDDVSIEGPIEERITIDASGNDSTPDVKDGRGSRCFNIDDGLADRRSEVSLRGLRLTGGDTGPGGGAVLNRENLLVVGAIITGNASRENGGGIMLADGSFTLRESTISNNAAVRGGGIHAAQQGIVIENSLIIGNLASSRGGGINLSGGGASLSPGRRRYLSIQSSVVDHSHANH